MDLCFSLVEEESDIGFNVMFQKNDGGERVEVYEKGRVGLQNEQLKVNLISQDSGTFFIVWYNSFSWLTDKTVQYTIVVSEPCSRKQRRDRRVEEAVREMKVVDKERAACCVAMNALQETLVEQSKTVKEFVQRVGLLQNRYSQDHTERSQVLMTVQSTRQELSNYMQVLDNMQAKSGAQIETLGALETTFRLESQELHLMAQLSHEMDKESS